MLIPLCMKYDLGLDMDGVEGHIICAPDFYQ